MEETELQQGYSRLLEDEAFDQLALRLEDPNIFNVLGISRYELRHSNFLQWCLNPTENHGLGGDFLKRILREISSDDKAELLSLYDIESLDYSNVDVRREWQDIDLLIQVEDLVVVIENKVDSKDHSNQLSKYKRIAESEFPDKRLVFVYLTPFGTAPSELADVYVLLSYQSIIDVLTYCLKLNRSSVSNASNVFISDYIQNLKRSLMGNDITNELAVKIYKNHKALLDFIFENKPDEAAYIAKLFAEEFEKRGYVLGSKNKGFARFTTKSLNELIPKQMGSNGWPDKECLLFEFNFLWNQPKVQFFITIAPGNEVVRPFLRKALDPLIGEGKFRKPQGEKWLVYFGDTVNKKMETLMQAEESEVREFINKQLDRYKSAVETVESSILKYEKDIKKAVEGAQNN